MMCDDEHSLYPCDSRVFYRFFVSKFRLPFRLKRMSIVGTQFRGVNRTFIPNTNPSMLMVSVGDVQQRRITGCSRTRAHKFQRPTEVPTSGFLFEFDI